LTLTNRFNATPLGVITKEQTLLSTQRLPVANATNIAQGKLLTYAAAEAGLIVAPTTPVAGSSWFVALADADNTAGSEGDISCPVAVRGHFVTVKADGVIAPGQPVKSSTNVAGSVMAFVEGTDAEGLKVGIYWGKEGGQVTIDSVTPFEEVFSDNENFMPVDAATGDTIEVELR
jgi:hypothetical protein